MPNPDNKDPMVPQQDNSVFDSIPVKQMPWSTTMNESDNQRSTKALKQCAEWLKACLDVGWSKESLDDLERLWWKYHDNRGRLLAMTDTLSDAELVRIRHFVTVLRLRAENVRILKDRDELSATIEACHDLLDRIDPEYVEGTTSLVPLETRLKELFPAGIDSERGLSDGM